MVGQIRPRVLPRRFELGISAQKGVELRQEGRIEIGQVAGESKIAWQLAACASAPCGLFRRRQLVEGVGLAAGIDEGGQDGSAALGTLLLIGVIDGPRATQNPIDVVSVITAETLGKRDVHALQVLQMAIDFGRLGESPQSIDAAAAGDDE